MVQWSTFRSLVAVVVEGVLVVSSPGSKGVSSVRLQRGRNLAHICLNSTKAKFRRIFQPLIQLNVLP